MLLAAAESILVERGVNALSVRKVGDAAGLNPALVTYHFKSILNLLDELCSLNLNPILRDWRVIVPGLGQDGGLEEVLRAWLAPMLRPAAFTPGGRALIVIDEIASHGEPALRERVLGEMEQFSVRLRRVVAPHVPWLTERELRARLRFISAAVLGPPPRVPVQGREVRMPTDGLADLLPFALAGLSR